MSLDIELKYVLWTSAVIIELWCGQVIELRSAKEKTCTPSNLNSICLAQSKKIFCPYNSLILDNGNWIDVFFLNLYWDNSICTVAPSSQKKLLYTGYWDYWIGMSSLNWLLLKKGLRLFSPLLLHLCVPINISYIETTEQFVWDVVVWSLNNCVLTVLYFIQPLFKNF